MSGGFHVDPGALSKSANGLLSSGKTLAGDVAAFQSQTAALKDAFGGDDLGSALETIYEVASQAAFECFHDNAESLQDIGHNLHAMAKTYSDIDADVQDSLQRLLRSLT